MRVAWYGGYITLQKHRPVLFLATHGQEVHRACIIFIDDRQYKVSSLNDGPVDEANEVIARPM